MNTFAKIAIVLIVGGTGFAAFKWQSYIRDLNGRFPEIDPKIRRKAFREMLKSSATSKYGDITDYNDEQMDQIFLAEVAQLTS